MATILLIANGDSRLDERIRTIVSADRHNLVVISKGLYPLDIKWRPDLILVDVASGEAFDPVTLHSYCRGGRRVPSLALVDERDMLQFRNGVTDFLVKPIRDDELMLRVRRLLDKKGVEGGDVMCFGDLAINTGSYDVTLSGRKLDLTFTEYELLKLLASNAGRVLTREAILNEVWGYDCFVGDRTVDVHIRRLRSKLEDAGASYIETIRNVGYRFKAG